jgi:chaperonin GroEL
VKRGIDAAVERSSASCKSMSKKVESSKEIAQVGTCSANQDKQIGDIIAKAMDKVGKDGVITVEEGKSLEHRGRARRGHAVRQGLPVAPLRHQPGDDGDTLENPYILIHEKKISSAKDMLPILGKIADAGASSAHHRRGHRG